MAERLSVTIALEGAEEIKRQLAEVGRAGQKAFADINQAAADVGGFNKLDPGIVSQKLAAAGVTGKEAFDKINTAVKQASRMESLVNGIAAVEKGFAAAGTAIRGMGSALTALIPSARTLGRILLAVVSAATVGAIVSTTKALLDLDAAATKAGISIGDMAKARAIFDAIGLSSKAAKDAVSGFISELEKITLAKVKEAAADLDAFGRSAKAGSDSLKILEEAAKGAGEAGDLARKKLAEMGKAVPGISDAAKEIDKIKTSALSVPDKIQAIIAVLEKMGPSAERNRLASIFGPDFVQALNAGGVALENWKKKLAETPPVTKDAADAAIRLSLEWEKLKTALASPFIPSAGTLTFIADLVAGFANLRQHAQQDLAAIGGFFAALPGNIVAAFSQIGSNLWNGFVQGASAAGNAVSQFFSQLPGQIAGFFASLGGTLWQGLVSSAQQAAQSVLSFFSQLPGRIAGFFSGLGAGLWDGIVSSAQNAWNKIIGFIERAIEKVRQFLGMGGGQAAGAGAQGMARGGIIGGRGTGTSDSNLAWVSRGEHVMPAYAVRQPGVLALLEALRRSGGNLRGVLDRLGHFALGGMVLPAFADGGVVGMSHVTIAFPGLPSVGGLRAPRSVVEELHRAAAMAQVRSGGRKPSRYS